MGKTQEVIGGWSKGPSLLWMIKVTEESLEKPLWWNYVASLSSYSVEVFEKMRLTKEPEELVETKIMANETGRVVDTEIK